MTLLPAPVDISGDPVSDTERSEALRLAVLVLLETLSPAERAAYILREAFDYSYLQIADILQFLERRDLPGRDKWTGIRSQVA